jgi:predicted dehydrogenase
MLNVGIIACGHWGKSYVRAFSEMNEARVIACSDLIHSNLEIVKSRYPHVEITEDYTGLVSNP